jgi:hypothetical protein
MPGSPLFAEARVSCQVCGHAAVHGTLEMLELTDQSTHLLDSAVDLSALTSHLVLRSVKVFDYLLDLIGA